jgi:hypothetical protein
MFCLDVRTNSNYCPVQAKREGRDCIVRRLRAGGFEVRTPVGARFSAPFQTDTEANPASCTMGTGARSWKWPERGVDRPPHLVPRLKKSTAEPLLSLYAFSTCCSGNRLRVNRRNGRVTERHCIIIIIIIIIWKTQFTVLKVPARPSGRDKLDTK